jgi:hypothetical protein
MPLPEGTFRLKRPKAAPFLGQNSMRTRLYSSSAKTLLQFFLPVKRIGATKDCPLPGETAINRWLLRNQLKNKGLTRYSV